MKETWNKGTHRLSYTIALEDAPPLTISGQEYRPVSMRLIFSWVEDRETSVCWVLEVRRMLPSGVLSHTTGTLNQTQFRSVPKWVQDIITRGMPVR